MDKELLKRIEATETRLKTIEEQLNACQNTNSEVTYSVSLKVVTSFLIFDFNLVKNGIKKWKNPFERG